MTAAAARCELCGKPIAGAPWWFFGKPHCASCMDYIQRGDADDLETEPLDDGPDEAIQPGDYPR